MTASVCPTLGELGSFLSGNLTAQDSERIEAHLADCNACCRHCMEHDVQDPLLNRVRRVMNSDEWIAGSSAGGRFEATDVATRLTADDVVPPDEADAIEGYRIIEELGRGGMGVVYRAYQKTTKREVALKLLIEGSFASAGTKRRFEREVEVAASLSHPNIVSILESGRTRGRTYFAMPLMGGLALDRYVRRGEGAVRETVVLLAKVCSAVGHAHLRGVIHRDLKPSNVIVSADGEPHVLDFGLAKWIASGAESSGRASLHTHSGQIMGTVPYMSPEQASGRHVDTDIRSDVYSLGVILFRQLTGHYPYDVTGPIQETLAHITHTDPPRASSLRRDIAGDVDAIVAKALCKEPSRRYQSAGELARDLHRWLRGQAVEAKRDHPLYVMRKMIYRARVPIAIGAVVLIVASMGALGWLRERDATRQRQARDLITALASQPVSAVARLDQVGAVLAELVRGGLSKLVASPVAAERVAGVRGILFSEPAVFWRGVAGEGEAGEGGVLWRHGEWLELCALPRELAQAVKPQLLEKCARGSERERYVALCLLGALADRLDLEAGTACAEVARNAKAPGVISAALWAAARYGISVDPVSSDAYFDDALSGLHFARVPAHAAFRKGTHGDDPYMGFDEEPSDQGIAIAALYMATTEVTWTTFERFLTANGEDEQVAADLREWYERIATIGSEPVEDPARAGAGRVTFAMAQRFCAWLTAEGRRWEPRRSYRLPTEDEWEYAARAGHGGMFCFGSDPRYLRHFANADGMSDSWHQVGLPMPNAYGLFDMHGGLWEWCNTRYPPQLAAHFNLQDEVLWVQRGGASYSPGVVCRSAGRNFAAAHVALDYNGFRIVMELEHP